MFTFHDPQVAEMARLASATNATMERSWYVEPEYDFAVIPPEHAVRAKYARAEYGTENGEMQVWGVKVQADFRGQGYGRKLMRKVLRLAAKDASIHTLSLFVESDNTPAVRLYESLGFQHSGKYRYGGEYMALPIAQPQAQAA